MLWQKRNFRKLEDLNLCDDFLFKEVMSDEKLIIGLLEMILDLKGKISKVKFVETEKTIQAGQLGKSIRLDVFVEDEEGKVYDIEVQNENFEDIGKRVRKYQSQMDYLLLKQGEDYSKLKEQIIIFLCTGDPFGREKYKYTFANRCLEELGLEMGDETSKIFLNSKGRIGEICPELKTFLKFLETSTKEVAEDSGDEFVNSLYRKIEFVKHNDDVGERFMTLEEKLQEVAKKEKKEIAKHLKLEGISVEVIAKATGLTVEEIERL